MSTSTPAPPARIWDTRSQWLPDLLLGSAVFLAGVYETYALHDDDGWGVATLWVSLMTGTAVGLSRRLPSVALALVWLTCAYQVANNVPVLIIQASIAIVSFGTARWGRTLTLLLSAVSIPLAGALATSYADARIFGSIGNAQYQRLLDTVQQFGTTWQIGAAVLGMAVLAVPWLAGLTLRFSNRASASRASQQVAEAQAAQAHRETEQAQEIARLREEQTKLAHDVHDVVGHSLAVILAQAESAQYLDEADTDALRLSMQNIASSARSSLQDVRQVLTPTPDVDAGLGSLHDLVDGVRASGHVVRSTESGTPRPLPPELATVAYRVLQEMLTNAIRHGVREKSTKVGLHWGEDLRIEVTNAIGVVPADPTGGQGVDGMRRRLASVGGRLDVVRRDSGDGETFAAVAHVPLRTVYP